MPGTVYKRLKPNKRMFEGNFIATFIVHFLSSIFASPPFRLLFTTMLLLGVCRLIMFSVFMCYVIKSELHGFTSFD